MKNIQNKSFLFAIAAASALLFVFSCLPIGTMALKASAQTDKVETREGYTIFGKWNILLAVCGMAGINSACQLADF